MKLFGEKRLVNSVKLLPLNIKLINAIQKHPPITESYACILKIFAMPLLLIKFLIFFGISSTPKSPQPSNEFQHQNTHQDLLYMLHLLFYKADYL